MFWLSVQGCTVHHGGMAAGALAWLVTLHLQLGSRKRNAGAQLTFTFYSVPFLGWVFPPQPNGETLSQMYLEPRLSAHCKFHQADNQYLLSQLGHNYTSSSSSVRLLWGAVFSKVAVTTASQVPRVGMLMICGKNCDLTSLPSFSNSLKTPLGVSCHVDHLDTSLICAHKTSTSGTIPQYVYESSINTQKVLRRPSVTINLQSI